MRVRPSAILIRDGKLLTLKYEYDNGSIYSLPGGNLEFGEEIKSALARELEEEIGIEVNPESLAVIVETFFEGFNTVHFVFKCDDFSKEPLINSKETTAKEIVWLPITELKKYTLYPNIGSTIANLNNDLPLFLGVIDQPRY